MMNGRLTHTSLQRSDQLIKKVLWVQCNDVSSTIFTPLIIAGKDAEKLQEGSIIEPTLFSSEITAYAPFGTVTSALCSQWLTMASESSADVTLILFHNKAPFKAVKEHSPEIIDITGKSKSSISTMFDIAGRDVDKGAITLISSAKDRAAQVVCNLIVQTDGRITKDIAKEHIPLPEEKLYLVVDSVLSGNPHELERMFDSFHEYSVAWEAVSGFMVKQIPALVACSSAPYSEKKDIATSLGISEKSVNFFLRKVPQWDDHQKSLMMWLTGWMDEQVKSGTAQSNPGIVKSALRMMVRVQ